MTNPKPTYLDLYTWGTPNGRKISILLEELGLPYRYHSIDITNGEQSLPTFKKLNPNGKIPALEDHETGQKLMESGAIMLYLASKTGNLLGEAGSVAYWAQVQWLMLQVGGIGPMLGQLHHFAKFNPGKSDYAETRYKSEADRLYGLLNERLKDNEYLAETYSVADISVWPWIARFDYQGMNLNDYPALKKWYLSIADRPAVKLGYIVPSDAEIPLPAQ